IPQQINDYMFDRSIFASYERPHTLPPGNTWPPRDVYNLLRAVGSEGGDCIGDTCYTDTICRNHRCKHTFEQLKASTHNWQEHFWLYKTADRGIGVRTKRAWKKGDVLGWYAGEVIADTGKDCTGDYYMEMSVGVPSRLPSLYEYESDSEYEPDDTPPSNPTQYAQREATVLIDASRKGNWIRFINHSCDAYTDFCIRRVGPLRIMIIEASKDIPAAVELSVNYGDEYYGKDTARMCYCGTKKCVSRFREDWEREMGSKEKDRKVKTKSCSGRKKGRKPKI
ncbi:SET domain-containing protein, partial [Ophiobolus disseminans]